MRSIAAIVVLGAVACGPSLNTSTGESDEVAVRTWLDSSPRAGGGILVVQLEADPDLSLTTAKPDVNGLSFTEDGEAQRESLGSRELITRRYRFSGEPGHYEIPAIGVQWTSEDGTVGDASSSPLFVDIDMEAPRDSELIAPEDPSRVYAIPWMWICGLSGCAGSAVVGAGVGVWAWRRRDLTLPEVPPEPPDVVALRAWEAVFSDPSLDDLQKATAIAKIFREYMEAVFSMPCTTWTTSEVLDRLRQMKYLDSENVPRAKRLLRATDRVKFAEAEASQNLFRELDSDLRRFVGTTRPRQYTDEAP